jgi:hypothetical protein
MSSHAAYTNAGAGIAGLSSIIVGDALPDVHHIILGVIVALVVKVCGMGLDAMWARSRWGRRKDDPPPPPAPPSSGALPPPRRRMDSHGNVPR